jgi:hypothetical protein
VSDPDDFCRGCGDASWACGCPFDLHTQNKVRCQDCGAQWWVSWGGPDRPCHGCGSTNCVTVQAAEYAPFVELPKAVTG